MSDDGFSLDELDGFDLPDASQAARLAESLIAKNKPRLQYTIKLNKDSPYFSTSWEELQGATVEIEVEKDGKHTFKVVNIVDTYDLKNAMERKLMVVEV